MRVYEGSRGIAEPDRGCVLTIGNLDGLHLGHQALLSAVTERAGVLGVAKAVYTFDPHPVQVLYPERAQPRLMSADQLEVFKPPTATSLPERDNAGSVRYGHRAFSAIAAGEAAQSSGRVRFQLAGVCCLILIGGIVGGIIAKMVSQRD